jgi:hypothetical protein
MVLTQAAASKHHQAEIDVLTLSQLVSTRTGDLSERAFGRPGG